MREKQRQRQSLDISTSKLLIDASQTNLQRHDISGSSLNYHPFITYIPQALHFATPHSAPGETL